MVGAQFSRFRPSKKWSRDRLWTATAHDIEKNCFRCRLRTHVFGPGLVFGRFWGPFLISFKLCELHLIYYCKWSCDLKSHISSGWQFGLFHQLWSKEEIEDNEPHLTVVPKTEPKPEPIKKNQYSSEELVSMIMNELNVKMKDDEQKRLWVLSKANQYKIQGEGSKLQQMTVLQLRNCLQELENGKF